VSWIAGTLAAFRRAFSKQDLTAFPKFRYHPDPLATGAVIPTDLACDCCGNARGFRVASHYGTQPFDCICPWCVADGRAAKRLGASFVQDAEDDLSPAIWDKLTHRTPGYESWQGELWLTHCKDACAFHGDLSRDEIGNLSPETEAAFLEENDWLDDWSDLKDAYAAGNSSKSLYKFVCLHCGTVRIGVDFS